MSDHKAEIYYYDIGDYLSREQKLDIITNFKSMENLPFTRLTPNEHGDWISLRNDRFGTWIPIGDKDNKNNKSTFFTPNYSCGAQTNRDTWVYNFSEKEICKNAQLMVSHYNEQIEVYKKTNKEESLNNDESYIKWTSSLLPKLKNGQKAEFADSYKRIALYRPFTKNYFYFDTFFIHRPYQIPKLFPTPDSKNLLIGVNGVGSAKEFCALITDTLPDLEYVSKSQCFPLYWYEVIEPDQHSLFGDDDAQIVKHEAISDFILERAQSKYGNKVQREDIFYYVYGILHSKSYRETFSADLKKMLPRIPLVSDYEKFWAFSKAGRDLANLHLNYEKVAPCPDVTVESLNNAVFEIPKPRNASDDALMVAEGNASANPDEYAYYAVEQMKFPKKGQKDTIIYNHYHTIKNIPEKAYEYVVNGKSAIEWIMERYAVTTDQKSGITNNPNDWSREHEKPRYIFDLLLSVINVSVQTVGIVNGLPEVDWDKE